MTGLKFLCIVSSVREGRLATRMIKLVENEFAKKMKPNGHTLEILDPEDYDLPVLKQPLHFYPDQSKAPASLHKMNKIVQAADAYLILTAEYNRTLPPALTNTLDHLPPPSFDHKASGIIAYSMGPQGGVLATVAARTLLAEMGCLPVKTFSAIASAHKEVSEDGTTSNAHISSSIGKVFDDVEWWAGAAKNKRDQKC